MVIHDDQTAARKKLLPFKCVAAAVKFASVGQRVSDSFQRLPPGGTWSATRGDQAGTAATRSALSGAPASTVSQFNRCLDAFAGTYISH
jgi:hypothetical protein